MARTKDPDLRGRLIEAATEAFARQGFAGTRMEDVGRRAGVTKGGVYFHFRTKEELFFAVLDHWREMRRRELQLAPGGTLSGSGALRRFLRDYLAFHFRAPEASGLLRVLATEMRGRFTSQIREDARQEQRWLRARLREFLALGLRDGTLFAQDPAAAAFLLAAAVAGVLEQWQTAPRDVEAFCSHEQLADELVAPHATGAVQRRSEAAGAGEFDFRGY